MKVGICSDHRGLELKKDLIKYLKSLNVEVIDYGTDSKEFSDYPDYAFKVGEDVSKKKIKYGICICGSGIGMSIAANKVKGVRCAHVSTIKETYYTRNDNDANVIGIGADLSINKAHRIVETFLSTEFSKVDRYIKRNKKISKYEGSTYEC